MKAVSEAVRGAVSAALESLTDRDPARRDVAAAELGDLLRGSALDAETARVVAARLVGLTLREPVTHVRESALNALGEAFSRHALPLSVVEPLATALESMAAEPELLTHTLYLLGAPRNPRARPLIEPYLSHPDPRVREEAGLALAEFSGPRRHARDDDAVDDGDR
ncbi:HEAT repeat domain-containing protein [Streptomyces sp. NBC_01795]|uniref:HEAT repeat domain-containing protein n=1 Tax=unclassified Streptomyces TaxID=2593676 RepID=UPI002DD8DDCF|nr:MULTISPECIES: HEAT repeat domain-containing protein [unclassified Streptomyces]WSA91304.1 HEAT repeat domain-containing protein [Streptomyces sp. NBC_01795]WSB75628.1 HEAT repeat domain-containing protein [Streptomyces sp. NBC_01775]WSS16087.1 HEAT repeat domain-containing protein [Streptomyces sp. NBC_01186]